MRLLRRLNEAVYRTERWLIAGLSAFISATVFLHALHGGLAPYGVATCGDPGRAACGPAWGVAAAMAAILFLVGLAAVRARRREKKRPVEGAWLPALGIGLGAAAALEGYLWAFPRGWEWSSQLALSMLVWIGLLGASLVTKERRHIHVEAVTKFLPPALKRLAGLFANGLAAAACAFVAALGALFTAKMYASWADSGGRAAILEQLPWIPEWLVALGFPVAFGIMTLRFVGHAAGSLRGEGGPVEKEILQAEKLAAKGPE